MFVRAVFAIAFCWLCAGATPASAQISIDIQSPYSSYPLDEPFPISVFVTSASEVTSVQAAVGTRSTALAFASNAWSGTLSLDGLPRGEYQLVITATNAAGQTHHATRTILHDKRPVLTVTAPVEFALGLPDVRVIATCVDDGPTCQISVGMEFGTTLASGNGSLDTLIRPAAGIPRLKFAATDSAGRSVEVFRNVVVQSDPKFRAEAGFSGRILDIQPDRALIYDRTVTPAVVRIVDRATNASQIIWTAASANTLAPARGFLIPGGALFVADLAAMYQPRVLEWRGGTLSDLGRAAENSLEVNGQWAIYNVYNTNTGQYPLILRDLIAGTNTTVDSDTINSHNDVTADGRVFYCDYPGYQIFRFEQGAPPVTTQLTNSAPARSINPATDGVNVVFLRFPASGSGPVSVVLRKGDGAEVVLATHPYYSLSSASDYYGIANGWVAFPRAGAGGSVQAWLRAPDGTERQLSSTGGKATIVGLNGSGEVIFDTVVDATSGPDIARRYLARADGTIVDLGTPVGTPRFRDGAWSVIAGGQLLALDAETPARSILSEGATGTFFTTDVSILNPHQNAVPVTIRYLREGAPEIQETRTLPALSRTTIHEDDIPGLEGTSVSTVVDSPGTSPVVVERLMSWDATAYGGHLGTAVERPRVRWLFAEGAQGFFRTFFLLANSEATEATVRLTFLRERESPVEHTVKVAPGTRKTIAAGDIAGLIDRAFATVIDADVPIVAERAMYFGESPFLFGGHGSAGVPEPATSWFHAEGATGPLFDTFILLANPHAIDLYVDVTYVTDTGREIWRPHTLPALSRLTINIETESPELANAAVSTRVKASMPIVSERAMYWGTTGNGWREAHNSFGVTETGIKWGLAEGRAGGTRAYQTYVLVSNTSSSDAELRVTFVKEDGTTVVRPYGVAKSKRLNIDTGTIPELADSNFSTIVESINAVPIAVESAIYWSANGIIWEGGGNTTATRLP